MTCLKAYLSRLFSVDQLSGLIVWTTPQDSLPEAFLFLEILGVVTVAAVNNKQRNTTMIETFIQGCIIGGVIALIIKACKSS